MTGTKWIHTTMMPLESLVSSYIVFGRWTRVRDLFGRGFDGMALGLSVLRAFFRGLYVAFGPSSISAFEDPVEMRKDPILGLRTTYFVVSFVAAYLVPLFVFGQLWSRVWAREYPELAVEGPVRGPRGGSPKKSRELTRSEEARIRDGAWGCCGTVGWIGEGRFCVRRSAVWPLPFMTVVALLMTTLGFMGQVLKPTGVNAVAISPLVGVVLGIVTIAWDKIARPVALRRLDPGPVVLVSFLYEGIPVGIGNFLLVALAGARGNASVQLLVILGYRLVMVIIRWAYLNLAEAATSPKTSVLDMLLAGHFVLLTDELLTELVFLELEPFTLVFGIFVAYNFAKTILVHGGILHDVARFLRQRVAARAASPEQQEKATSTTLRHATRAVRATVADMRAVAEQVRTEHSNEEFLLLAPHATLPEAANSITAASRDLSIELLATIIVTLTVATEAFILSQSKGTLSPVMTFGLRNDISLTLAGYATILIVQCVAISIAWLMQVSRLIPSHRQTIKSHLLSTWSITPKATTTGPNVSFHNPMHPPTETTETLPISLSFYNHSFYEILGVSLFSVAVAISTTFWLKALEQKI